MEPMETQTSSHHVSISGRRIEMGLKHIIHQAMRGRRRGRDCEDGGEHVNYSLTCHV